MLILLIKPHCKICPLPTILSRVFVLFATDKLARSYCRQCAHFKTGTNEQNQYFAVMRQKVSLCIHVVVLQSGLPSLDGKLEHFVTKIWKKRLPNLSQTDYRALQWALWQLVCGGQSMFYSSKTLVYILSCGVIMMIFSVDSTN